MIDKLVIWKTSELLTEPLIFTVCILIAIVEFSIIFFEERTAVERQMKNTIKGIVFRV